MKKYILLLAFALVSCALCAQKKAPVIKPYSPDEAKEARKEADAAFKLLNYLPALRIYERLVVTEPNNAEYNHRLGLCYLSTNINKGKAVPYLEYVSNANTKEKPKEILFDLGRAYFYAGLYDQAIQSYESFREKKGGTVDAKLKFDMWVDWAYAAKKITATPVACTFSNPGKGINSPQADYRPVMGVADTIVYFCSKRKGTTGGLTDDLGESPADIYFFTQNDTSRSKAKTGGININTEFYEETMSLSLSGDRMLIYRESPEASGDIYISELQGKMWSKPVVVGKDFVTKVLETGGSISPDGSTLYFSAELVATKSGKDIYKCTRSEGGSWSKPERMSDVINTVLDEDMPMIWIDGKTLFFSSMGHNSMGGYDVFKAVMNDPREGFKQPVNIGYPINTVYDDYNIALNCSGTKAWVAAVRDSGMGDYDLWEVALEKSLIDQPMTWLQGAGITNLGTPAKGAYVVVTDKSTGIEIASLESNSANGRFDLALNPGTYKVVLKHPKAGKTEQEITVEPGTAKLVLNLLFP